MLRNLLPRPLRRAAGRARATLVDNDIRAELHRLARSNRPIIAGPWLGEVGFEVLYWVPWLRWMRETFGIDASRLVAVSRGGPSSWYHDIAGRYIDVFDHFTIDEFRAGNQQRRIDLGEQKQVMDAAFDRQIVATIRDREGLHDAETLHPSLMYRSFQPYWWKHATAQWVLDHARYACLPVVALPAGLRATPGDYVAVKFYFNDCLADDDRTRRLASQVIRALAATGPVVSLNTELALDDHAGAREEASGQIESIATVVSPRNNLAVQTAVLANARSFVGTYGGFSYLAPFHGVPTTAVYQNAQGFDRSHLEMARCAFECAGAARFDVVDMSSIGAEQLVDQLASPPA